MQKDSKIDVCVVHGLKGSLWFTILISVIINQNQH